MNFHLGLIGYPIGHSLSPWIHNQFLEKTNHNGSYSLVEIEQDEFANKIHELMESDIDGFNVTTPYKQEIIPYLDELDDYAAQIGAVNTVANKDGKWIGYNTDGIGYIYSLKATYPSLFRDKDIRIILLGAGGAARGIFSALSSEGFRYIDIANRSLKKAREIKALGNHITTTEILSLKEAEENLGHYELIIQTTNVGMNEKAQLIDLKNRKDSAIISDIVYQPIMTEFLIQAKELGNSVHCGHSMLLYQAQAAFEIWTHTKVRIGDMEEKLQTILEGKQHADR
ncbi:shikimate dehydrogenase [Ornithinibacillus sp. L9]|uniref:Shikimate dehydrogenase (NADP(+)) n=1 Tax=Ornithinibacillus caprae TaxID=2678566 RepID=A0A6N8FH42_9BACI|nr:shikimate dehydrogenase [Ornithinibacillus caprae]MUK87059.1 shikimate dehydrogenase [Ornithinibacillus caprae]